MEIEPEFEFVRYQQDGHFKQHEDRQRSTAQTRDGHSVSHTYTVCIYPPQEVKGGELIFSLISSRHVIAMPKDKWVVLLFPIDFPHESSPVTSGQKILFKGMGLSYVNQSIAAPFWEERAGRCD